MATRSIAASRPVAGEARLPRYEYCNGCESSLKEENVKRRTSSRLGLVLLMAAASFQFACSGKENQAAPDSADVIVRVGDATLTLQQIVAEIPPAMRSSISKDQLHGYISNWITTQLLYQEAKRQGLDKKPEVQARLQHVERELLGEALIDQEIGNRDWTISDSEIQQFYRDNGESFKRSEAEIQLWHIAVPSQQTADSLRRVLTSGTLFSRVAQERAQAQGRPNSWEIHLPESEVPEAAKEILKLRPGALSAPVALDNAYHVFYVVDRFRPESLRPLAQVRDEIQALLKARKQEERHRALLAELTNSTTIEQNYQLLEGLAVDSLMSPTRNPRP